MKYDINKQRRRERRLFVGLAIVASFAVVFAMVSFMVFRSAPPRSTEQPVRANQASGEKLISRILFVGDVMWGRAVQRRAEASGLGYKYLTSGLSMGDRSQYDAWIGNFECPITTKDVPYQLQIAILKFNCRPEYLPNLAKWFTAVSQANNHTMNVDGQWGIEQGRKHLEAAGIQYFGNYDMNKLDDICEVVTLPATLAKAKQIVSLPVALCGYMQVVNVPPTNAQLAVMKKYAKVMPVIAMPHMGVEYRTTAEPEKVLAYHRMIDAGADAVIAAHPHVIQNSESYKGRLIVYSLGNFLFDQQSIGPETTRGLGVGLSITIDDASGVAAYQALAPSCKAYKDNCATALATKLTKRPKITVSYSFTCYDESRVVGEVPHLGSQSVCETAKREATVSKLKNLARQW